MKRNISSAIIAQTPGVVQFPTPTPQPLRLRDYQLRLKKSLYQEISKGRKRVCVFVPTGGGKTIIAAVVTYDASIRRQQRVLFIVHRDVPIQQTLDKADCSEPPLSWIARQMELEFGGEANG